MATAGMTILSLILSANNLSICEYGDRLLK